MSGMKTRTDKKMTDTRRRPPSRGDDSNNENPKRDEGTSTQYGIRLPNGELIWGSDDRGQFRHHPEQIATDKAARKRWREDLQQMAISVGITPEWFIAQHEVVSCEIVTTLTDPVPVALPSDSEPE